MVRMNLGVACFFAVLVGLLFISGCVSMRSDFVSVGEEELFVEDFKGDLSAWNIEVGGEVKHVRNENRSFFQFLSPGCATAKNSVVSDFRMEFDIRLDAPLESDIAFAMINFRNYVNKRYCLGIEPTLTSLKVARIEHHSLEEIATMETSHTPGRWYKYEIVAVANRLKVFKNKILIIDIQDHGPPIDQGNIWFENHAGYSFSNVSFFNIEDFQEIAKQAETNPPEVKKLLPEDRLTVAVADFENLGVASYEASLLTDLYSNSLLSTGVFRVLERKELVKILAEQELQLSDITEEKGIVQVGRILNAKYLSTGSCGKLGQGYVVNLKLIDVETGETVVSIDRRLSNPEEITESFQSLSEQIAVQISAR